MKYASRLLILMFLGFLNSACSPSDDDTTAITTTTPATTSVTGSGVKGPLAGAITRLYKVDLAQTDLKGALLDEGSTTDNAAISDLYIENNLTGLLLLEFIVDEDTVEINTGKAPVLDHLITVFEVQRVYDGDSIYASPFTTMAVSLAQKKADKSSPYIGNGDGVISEVEFIAALGFAQNQLKSTVGFGLDTSVDIFVVPPMITDETDTAAEQTAVVKYRQAIEALAAIAIQISEDSTASDTPQEIIDALIEDLSDGDIDGQSNEGVVDTLLALDVPIQTTMAAVDLTALLIPGTTTPVTDIETELVTEMATTGESTDISELEDDTIEVDLTMPELITDIDGDGVDDSLDAFPSDATEAIDTDSDGKGNNTDTDDDGDNVVDSSDAFPLDATESVDTDSDGTGNNADTDDDGDGVADVSDAFPLDAAESIDTDSDGVGNNTDDDDDGDNVVDSSDVFPLDATESIDTDNDGIGNNADSDDDGDSVVDSSDAFPLNATESVDTDGDGMGNNADTDDDGDGVADVSDALPLDVTESIDTDSDGIGNNADTDDDGDGVADVSDAFPLDLTEWTDTDGDLIGNNADTDDDNDSVGDNRDAFPTDPALTTLLTQKAWIGADATELSFSAGSDGVELYRSTDANCDISNYTLCADGQMDILVDGLSVTDTALNTSRAAYYTASYNGNQTTSTVSPHELAADSYSKFVEFKGKLWFHSGDYKNEGVSSSTDGINWVKHTVQYTGADTFPFKLRDGGFAVFNDKLWLIGGFKGTKYTAVSSVWSSDDGITWTLETSELHADFKARYNHNVTVFDGKLWVIGGYDPDPAVDARLDEVWSSSDGVNWEEVTTEEPKFSGRSSFSLVVFDNRMWVIAGTSDSNSYEGDIWSSDNNGINWTKETDLAPFGERFGMTVTQFDNKLWLIGGNAFGSANKNDVWSSSNGTSWTRETESADFHARKYHSTVIFNSTLWLLGGSDIYFYPNSAWSSANGVDWTRETNGAEFTNRFQHASVSYKDKLWIIGGSDGKDVLNDVWSSSDGFAWTLETANAGFSPRHARNHVLVHDGKMWLVGGYSNSDVWFTENGVSWNQVSSSFPLGDREAYTVIAAFGKMWAIGGYHRDSDTRYNDIWSSSDGIIWEPEPETAPFSPRNYHELIFENDQLWLIGGHDGTSYLKEVWLSDDGRNWTPVTNTAAFPASNFYSAFAFNNQLWLLSFDHNLWTSSDTWTQISDGSFFRGYRGYPGRLATATVFDSKLFLTGGMIPNMSDSDVLVDDVWSSIDGASWYKAHQSNTQF